MYYNARSLFPELDELRAACLVHSPDIICVTETWFGQTIVNDELYLQNCEIVRRNHSRQGGGINCYSHSMGLMTLS